MIDFVKLRILDPDIQGIRDNPLLEWKVEVYDNTGDIDIKERTAIFHGIIFKIKKDKYLNIYGSIHKYWNSINGRGEHNYNDFHFMDLVSVIVEFCELFNLSPLSCIIENIEFGINISPSTPVNEILRSVINHKGKPFDQENRKYKRFINCVHNQYIVKIYDKGLQYKQPGNLMRFENKTIKMEHLKGVGIVSLADLLDPDKIVRLGAILKGNWGDLLIYDYTIPTQGINAKDNLILANGQNPRFWESYMETNPNNYFKKRDRFRELVKQYAKQDIQGVIGEMISLKWAELLTTNEKTLQELTGVTEKNITEYDNSIIGSDTVKLEQGNPIEKKPRFCQSCGRDISNQKEGSKFCSAKYVGYQLAHKCRNDNSNFHNRKKYMIERENKVLTLFSTIPFFNEPKRQNARN